MSKKQPLFISLLLLVSLLMQATQPSMKKIFNGKNLQGWVEPENNIWWSAKDGILTAKSDADRTGSILWTEKAYENFVFQTDFKMGEGTVDSGVFIRSEELQIQIGISGSLKRDMTASPYVPGKAYPVEAKGVQEVLNPQGWNTMKIEAKDQHVTVWLNQQQVMSYTAEGAPKKGPIGLQLHPNNHMSIDFKNILVAEL